MAASSLIRACLHCRTILLAYSVEEGMPIRRYASADRRAAGAPPAAQDTAGSAGGPATWRRGSGWRHCPAAGKLKSPMTGMEHEASVSKISRKPIPHPRSLPPVPKGALLSVESGVIRRGPDSPRNFGATSPEPVTTAAPPRRECARRGLDPIPPPNRKDETMQDTVDQAYGAVPRTLANIIEDARRSAGEADAGRHALGTSGSQGSLGKDPSSIEGNGPGKCQAAPATRANSVARCSRFSDRLDQLVPAEDGEAAARSGLPERSDLRELVMPGTTCHGRDFGMRKGRPGAHRGVIC